MRISDWSSDVCSSDLLETKALFGEQLIEHCKTPDKWHFVRERFDGLVAGQSDTQFWVVSDDPHFTYGKPDTLAALKSVPDADGFSDEGDRTKVVKGKGVSERVGFGGGGNKKKKK